MFSPVGSIASTKTLASPSDTCECGTDSEANSRHESGIVRVRKNGSDRTTSVSFKGRTLRLEIGIRKEETASPFASEAGAEISRVDLSCLR